MSINNKRTGLLIIGVIAIASAWGIRHYIYTKYAYSIALTDPEVQKVSADLQKRQDAVAANPKDVKARWRLADMYQKLRLYDFAEQQLIEIKKLEPKSVAAGLALADLHLAMVKPDLAEAEYKEVAKNNPKNPAAYQGLSAVFYHQHRYFESMQSANMASKLEPNNPNHRYILATSILQYVDQYPNPTAYTAFILRAKQELEKILPVWPDPAAIEFRLGTANELLRDNKAALVHLNKALEAMPNRPDLRAEIARCYLQLSDRPGALKVVQAAINAKVTNPEIYDLYGQLIQTTKEPDANEKALKAFETAARAAPKNPLYVERFGAVCVRLNRLDDARKAFERSLMLNPERAYPYQQLAAIYTRLGDIKRSSAAAKAANEMVANDQQLRQIELLSQVHTNDVNLKLILADRYKDLGRKSAAWDMYLMVQKLDPGNKRAADGLIALKKMRDAEAAAATQ